MPPQDPWRVLTITHKWLPQASHPLLLRSFVPSFYLLIPSRSHHQTHTVAFPAFRAVSRWVTPVAWQWRMEREVLSSFNGAWQGWKHRREVENLETPLRRWFFPVILELRVAVLWSRKVSEIVEIRSAASQGWIWLALRCFWRTESSAGCILWLPWGGRCCEVYPAHFVTVNFVLLEWFNVANYGFGV